MNSIRELIQARLSSIEGLDAGVPLPDDMIVDGQTYFGYTLSEDFIDGDFDRYYSMQITMVGHLVRRNNSGENTLAIIDEMLDQIKVALKSLNMNYNYDDVSFNDNIRKIQLTATVQYNEINNWLI